MPQLTYPYQRQLLSEWCWSATAGSIAGFYRAGVALSQCAIADLVFKSPSCAGGVPNAGRNQPQSLDVPLRRLSNLGRIVSGRLLFTALAAEIDQGRPIGLRIQWVDQPGAGHMIALSGYDGSTRMVMVEDPKFGRGMFAYDILSQRYLGRGFWSFTYLTRRQSNV
jgi:hypothetical protein